MHELLRVGLAGEAKIEIAPRTLWESASTAT